MVKMWSDWGVPLAISQSYLDLCSVRDHTDSLGKTGYISSTFFGGFNFVPRDQSDQDSEGAVPVSLRDED